MQVALESNKKCGQLRSGLETAIHHTVSCQKSPKLPTGRNFLSRSCRFQHAQGLLVLEGWSCPSPDKEQASGCRRDAPRERSGWHVGVLERCCTHPPRSAVHNRHQIHRGRDSNVSCQGQTFPEAPNYHQPTRYFHKLLRRAHCKGSVRRQLVTRNSGYLKYMRGGRASRGHFGLCRRWKIVTTSALYTLFQGTNTCF